MANAALSLPRAASAGLVQAWRGRATADLTERLLVAVLLLAGLLAHGINMFNYPGITWKDDEGIYAAQAWAVLREGRLSPYTYFYDHAPAGWILLAGWMGVTGGIHTFGGAIESGRVFMLVLHLAQVVLLYRVAGKLGCSVPLAGTSALLFSLSPLAVYFHRLLMLDNIMMFWVLLSLDLLLDGWGRLSRLILSGAAFALACLTKETALFLVPAMLYLAFQQRWRHQGRFAVVAWVVPALLVASWYPLYAGLKGELLPAGMAFQFALLNIDNSEVRVSLIDALRWQATRTGGGLFNLDNLFWLNVRNEWFPRDPVLFGAGSLAILANLAEGFRERRALAAGALGFLPLLYLARGGLVFDYYVPFLVPFLCLNLAFLFSQRVRSHLHVPAGAALLVAVLSLSWGAGRLQPLYQERTTAASDAVEWIKQHVPPHSLIIVPDALWTDLREPGRPGQAFPHVYSHWKVGLDPAVRDGVFGTDWRSTDYLILTKGTEQGLRDVGNAVALEALSHAHLAKRWTAGDFTFVELWKVNKPGGTEQELLTRAAASLSRRFEREGAYVRRDGTVTSEGQAYAMLRAAWLDHQAEFYRVWAWTRTHLQNEEGLLAWLWKDGSVQDPHSASDADTDAALALIAAGRRWGDAALVDAGARMAKAIWQREVAVIGGKPYLTAGDWAVAGQVAALNPSYFAPYAYRVFQTVDGEHDWGALVDSSYEVLFAASAAPLGARHSAGLPPDWVGLDRESGQPVPLPLEGRDTTQYGYDAARTYWRVAVDLRWSGDGRARSYLSLAGFLRDEAQRKGGVSAVYRHNGTVVEEPPSMVGTAGAIAALLTLDPDLAGRAYAGHVIGGAEMEGGSVTWGDPKDLYSQEWAWFTLALYADAFQPGPALASSHDVT